MPMNHEDERKGRIPEGDRVRLTEHDLGLVDKPRYREGRGGNYNVGGLCYVGCTPILIGEGTGEAPLPSSSERLSE